MKTAAVIAEYNPFHNGHLYQLDTIRTQLGADCIIVIMSGDFTQRGIPAILDKYERCRLALEHGADVVFELPAYFALGSAEYFAQGAVSLADKLGVVDFLHFGSECGDIGILASCAKILAAESDEYRDSLGKSLKEGLSFPAARAAAVGASKAEKALPHGKILSEPNNILGVEYIKALLQRDSSITPVTICRSGSDYHASTLENGTFASADAIRERLMEMQKEKTRDFTSLREFMPDSAYEYLRATTHPFLSTNDFSQLLRYKLLGELQSPSEQLSVYYDVTPQLANTFRRNIRRFTTVSDFTTACKSKNLTYTRISRCLTHILLDMTQDTADTLKASDYCLYARLLGFGENGQKVLKQIKNNAAVPIITRPAKALKELDGIALASLKADIHASTVYQSARSPGAPFPDELTREVIKIS